MSSLRRVLEEGGFAVTAEVVPPLSCDPAALLAKALPLKGLADAVNVTDGAGARAHLDAVTAAAILAHNGIEPVLQLTARDRNRIALQSAMIAAAASGVVNLLLLRGDDPREGDQPAARPVFDLDTAAMVETALVIRDRGELPHGRKIGGKADFFIGVADAPVEPLPDWQPGGLTRKIAAGAEFAQTQFCMDAGLVRRYAARLKEQGILPGFRLMIGLAPIASVKSARWIRDHLPGSVVPHWVIDRLEQAADPVAEGIRICAELMQEMAGIEGIAGVHLMAPGNEAAIPEAITAFRS